MKFRLKLLLTTLLLSSPALAQVPVSGNLKDIGLGSVTSSVQVDFELQNYGSQIPHVVSTGTIVQVKKSFRPDGVGLISGSIYPNSVITPIGTFYRVCILIQGQVLRCNNYLINGPFDLNSAIPLNVTPVVGPSQLITQVFPCLKTTPATVWVCVHNFSDFNIDVALWDPAGNKIGGADNIVKTDANTVTITWVTAQAGLAVIVHAGAISIATNQPNAVLQNPTGAQSITGAALTLAASTPFFTNAADVHNGTETFNAALNALAGGSLAGTFTGPRTFLDSLTLTGALFSNGGITATAGILGNDITDSALTPGGCVQAGTGGHLTTVAACNTGGGGGITSVGLALPPQLSVSGSPVTPATGVLSATWQPVPSNYVFAGPALNSIGGIFDGTAATIGNSALSSLTDTPTTSHDWAFVAAQSIGQSAAPTMPGGWTKNFSAGNNGAVWNQVFNSNALISAPVTFATSANWAEVLFMLRLPGGSPTIVQSQSTTGAFTTSTNTFGSNVTAGNSIIAVFCGIPSAPMQATFTDARSNIYTLIGVAANGTNTICVAAMTATVLGGTTDPVTVTLNGLSTTSFFLTMEVSNLATPTAEPVMRALQPGDFPANISGPPIQVFLDCPLSGDVAVSASTQTTVKTCAVTMPATGCPCRAFISYSLYITTGTSGVGYEFSVGDGTNNHAGVNVGQSNGSSGALASASYGGYSKGTYSNGAVITFTLTTRGDHSYTVKAATQLGGLAPNSDFQIGISTSN